MKTIDVPQIKALAAEARRTAHVRGIVIVTREDTTLVSDGRAMYVVRFLERIGDSIYETGSAGLDEDEATARAYMAWQDFWRPKGTEPRWI